MNIGLAGLDPMRFLESTDPVEILVMTAIAEKIHELRAEANKS